MKIKIHPLFIVLSLYFVITGKAFMFGGYIIAVIVHEVAHNRAGHLKGYSLGEITLMPYGGVLKSNGDYADRDIAFIAFAGPVFNALCAVAVVAIWWLFPSSYSYTRDICVANLALCIVNILPVYPLDGFKIVSCIAKNKAKAKKIMKITGVAVGFVFILLSVVSIWFDFNFTIALFGAFLIYETLFWTGKEVELQVASENKYKKNYRAGVYKSEIVISENAMLLRAYSFIKKASVSYFYVVNDAGKQLYELTEEEIGVMIEECELTSTIAEAFNKCFN